MKSLQQASVSLNYTYSSSMSILGEILKRELNPYLSCHSVEPKQGHGTVKQSNLELVQQKEEGEREEGGDGGSRCDHANKSPLGIHINIEIRYSPICECGFRLTS